VDIRQQGVSKHVTSFSVSSSNFNEFNQSFLAVILDPQTFIALDDVISALINNHMAQANCGRAIERLRNIISPTAKGPAGWRAMQTALNISQDFLESISKDSTANRHGDAAAVPGPIVSLTIERTWQVMNRFIEYKKRGNSQLKEPEFPLLVL
jgi:hypothetical protein